MATSIEELLDKSERQTNSDKQKVTAREIFQNIISISKEEMNVNTTLNIFDIHIRI